VTRSIERRISLPAASRSHRCVLAAAVLATALATGCRDRAPAPEASQAVAPRDGASGAVRAAPRGPVLVDLSSSLEAIRADFNAHVDRNRFLTLLAPT
jgi:hypothetical protein